MKPDFVFSEHVIEELRQYNFGIFPELCKPEVDHSKEENLVKVHAFKGDKKTDLYCCWCGSLVRSVWE